MPIRPAASPPFSIVRLGYVELGVRDLSASRRFYVDMLGFIESASQDGAEDGVLYLRGLEERGHHSVVLVESAAPTARRIGYKVAGEADLERVADFFAARGLPTSWVDAPHRGRTLHVRDPFGVPLAFYAAMEQVERQLQQYGAYRGAQVQRLDHVNCFAADVQATHDFYAELGFRTSEYTETESSETEAGETKGSAPQLWAVWMHRKGNVHDLALTNGRGPRLHHVGVWVPGPMNILFACDLLATSGYAGALERGPGRHGISNAFFLYLRDPDGHRVELFANDYLTVDPDFEPIRWDLRDPQRQTLWGQPAPKSWFEEGSPFEETEVLEPTLDARPIVAR